MEYKVDRVLELRFEADEIDYFLQVVEILHNHYPRAGFRKPFNKQQQEFITYLYNNLVKDEKDNDTSK